MNRLTEKGTRKATQAACEITNGNTTIKKFVPNPETVKECKIYNKLADLEDVEEENKIDILQAVELCKKVNEQGYVFIKESYGISKLSILDKLDVELFNHRLYVNARGIATMLDLNRYGNIENADWCWALTKEDLL